MTKSDDSIRLRREARAAVFELQIVVESLAFGVEYLGEDLRTAGLEREFSTLKALAREAKEGVELLHQRIAAAFDPAPANDA
jgi:hypothetical protein